MTTPLARLGPLAVTVFVLLAGCAGREPPPRAAAWIGDSTAHLFVRVLSVEPLRDMALTAPDGRVFQPIRLIATDAAPAAPQHARPDFGLFGGGGSSGDFGAGISVGLPVRNRFGGGARAWRAGEGEFALPEAALASYRARPQDWRLQLHFSAGSASLPAPAPAAP